MCCSPAWGVPAAAGVLSPCIHEMVGAVRPLGSAHLSRSLHRIITRSQVRCGGGCETGSGRVIFADACHWVGVRVSVRHVPTRCGLHGACGPHSSGWGNKQRGRTDATAQAPVRPRRGAGGEAAFQSPQVVGPRPLLSSKRLGPDASGGLMETIGAAGGSPGKAIRHERSTAQPTARSAGRWARMGVRSAPAPRAFGAERSERRASGISNGSYWDLCWHTNSSILFD